MEYICLLIQFGKMIKAFASIHQQISKLFKIINIVSFFRELLRHRNKENGYY